MKHHTLPTSAVWAMVALSTGCATYSPAPIEPLPLLQELNAVEWQPNLAPASSADDDQSLASGPRELAAFAVTTNVQLKAVRGEVGLRRALLVEAGLLPDPELGWDAMNVLGSAMLGNAPSSHDYLSGLALMFPFLRPGELDARVGAAEWRAEEARRIVTAAEWALTRDVHIAYEEVQAAETLLAQTLALTELARTTTEYFERAREAGAATAIQANLALGELQAMLLNGIRAKARVAQARQALNGLLGLRPDTDILLRSGEDPSANESLVADPETLTAHAVESRPDLAVLLARYQSAEEDVRLAISFQYPSLAVGTGFSLTVPIFSKFGRPAIQTAIAQREVLAREFKAAVHAARQEIAAAHVLWQLAGQEVQLVEEGLLPNAEQNLELSQVAFQAGEVTLLETLALQRALVEARTLHTETRAERSKSAWNLLAASGWLLGATPNNNTNNAEITK